MWTQVVGKLALGLSPLTNHYWNTALQITPRGLATLPLTVDRRLITITFDFVSRELAGRCSSRSNGSSSGSGAASSARRVPYTSGGGASISPTRGSRAVPPPCTRVVSPTLPTP